VGPRDGLDGRGKFSAYRDSIPGPFSPQIKKNVISLTVCCLLPYTGGFHFSTSHITSVTAVLKHCHLRLDIPS
jgi:hypothetical protein